MDQNKDKKKINPAEPIFRRREISYKEIKEEDQSLEQIKEEIIEEEKEKDLINIYKDSSGQLPNMNRLERHKRSFLKLFLKIFLILVLMAGVLGGLFFYILNKKPAKFTGERIKLEIEAPQEIASGEEVSYIFKYNNGEKVFLKNVELEVRYPQNFIFRNAKPYPLNESNNSWQIGTLLGGEQGEIKITGQLIGEIDSVATFSALLSFWPENFNAEFQEMVSTEVKITSSNLRLTIEGPEQTLVNQKIEYAIKYKNVSREPLRDFKLTVIYSDNFTFRESDPKPSRRDNVWFLDLLKEEEEGKIIIRGEFRKEAKNKEELKVILEVKSQGEEYQLEQEKILNTKIVQGGLTLDLIINGSTENQAVEFGEPLNYTIVYKSNGQTVLKDLEITVFLEAKILDWLTLKESLGGRVVDDKIIWNKEQISRLAYLDTGEEGVIDFEINLNVNPEEVETEDYKVVSFAQAKIGFLGDLKADLTVESNKITNEVSSRVELETFGRYYDEEGQILGEGPLPPKVGEKTTYKIFWRLANGIHEVREVKITTTLPEYVFWENDFTVSAGELSYESDSRKIFWLINRLPAKYQGLEASFEIGITPTQDDINKLLILIPNAELEANDQITGNNISVLDGMVSTDLEGDSYAQGKGIVVK